MALKNKLEPEEPKRKPTTREEYESALEASLLDLEGTMQFAISDYNEMVKLYNKYFKDKRYFRIEYYKEEGSFIYTRHRKKKPGFEIPGVKR